ncbi:hypothetical protein GCM10007148_01150 [Parvularcula lutaonensis]|nr:hypothetical protein GCM10007148_01150 [Parvularcula lutaonensis]
MGHRGARIGEGGAGGEADLLRRAVQDLEPKRAFALGHHGKGFGRIETVTPPRLVRCQPVKPQIKNAFSNST